MSPVTDDYLADAGLRDVMARAPFPPVFAEGYGPYLLSRPLFVEEAAIRAAAADAVQVAKLVRSFPARLFDGDMGRYAAGVGADEHTARVVARGATGVAPIHGRPDLIFDGSEFRLLEINMGSELALTDIDGLNRALLADEAFGAFAETHELGYVATSELVADVLRRIGATVAGSREPTVAVLEWTGGFATLPALYRSFKETMAGHGLDVRLAEVTQVVNKDGKLYLDGHPIDVVLRYFNLHEVCSDPRGEELLEPILRAHTEGGTVLFTHPETNLFSYKDNLAFLSDPRYRQDFTAEEIALVDRFLPWTRLVRDSLTAGPDGSSVDLFEYCRAHRESLILKPHAGLGARGTIAGWEADDAEWDAALTTNEPGTYVVQHKVTSHLEPVADPESGAVEDWWPIWGLFLIDGQYGGAAIRAQRSSRSTVISLGRNAGVTTIFTH